MAAEEIYNQFGGYTELLMEYVGIKVEKDGDLLYFQHTDDEEYKNISKEEFTQLQNRYTKNKEKLEWKKLEGFWN